MKRLYIIISFVLLFGSLYLFAEDMKDLLTQANEDLSNTIGTVGLWFIMGAYGVMIIGGTVMAYFFFDKKNKQGQEESPIQKVYLPTFGVMLVVMFVAPYLIDFISNALTGDTDILNNALQKFIKGAFS